MSYKASASSYNYNTMTNFFGLGLPSYWNAVTWRCTLMIRIHELEVCNFYPYVNFYILTNPHWIELRIFLLRYQWSPCGDFGRERSMRVVTHGNSCHPALRTQCLVHSCVCTFARITNGRHFNSVMPMKIHMQQKSNLYLTVAINTKGYNCKYVISLFLFFLNEYALYKHAYYCLCSW